MGLELGLDCRAASSQLDRRRSNLKVPLSPTWLGLGVRARVRVGVRVRVRALVAHRAVATVVSSRAVAGRGGCEPGLVRVKDGAKLGLSRVRVKVLGLGLHGVSGYEPQACASSGLTGGAKLSGSGE